MKTAPVLAAALIGCADVPQPFELDHTRIMAVRLDPPALAPGERAKIDVLITDTSAVPRLADPASVSVTTPAGRGVERTADGWYAVAPSAGELAATRTALGVAPGDDVIVPLALEVAMPDGTLTAQKTVALGTHADNPAAPEIAFDPVADLLTASPSDPAMSYRWFSSLGDLTGYTRAAAELDAGPGDAGTVVLVVRDQTGGTAWTIRPLTVPD